MKAALLAIALTLGFGAAAGPRDAVSERDATPDGLLVLAVLTPERAMLADPRTGATTARELSGGTLCHGPLLAAGDGAVAFDLDEQNELVARAVSLEGRASDRALGRADTAIASSTPGRLWLGRALDADRHTQRIALREIDADGRVHRRAAGLLPRSAGLTAVMDDGGLVFTRGRGLAMRRPGRPRLLFEGGWPMAADGERLAWCDRECRRVRIHSAAGDRSFTPPEGVRPRSYPAAAFSPDGRRLALPLAGSRIAVLDLSAGDWRVVPGARTADYKALAWSPSGRWLYFTGAKDRLFASRDGANRPRALPIRTGGTVMSIVSTPGSAAR